MYIPESKPNKVWLWLSMVLLIIYFVFGVVMRLMPTNGMDVGITLALQSSATGWLTGLMRAVSWFGTQFNLLSLLVLAISLLFIVAHRWMEAFYILVTFLLAYGMMDSMSKIFQRARPTASSVQILTTQYPSPYSYPSGPTTLYTVVLGSVTCMIWLSLRWPLWAKALYTIGSAILVVLIGIACIYLGDQWFSDVLGAYLLVGAVLSFSYWLYEMMRIRSTKIQGYIDDLPIHRKKTQ